MNFAELIKKKVAGIPVLYLAGAAVLVLAIVAWRMKPSADFEAAEGEAQGAPEAPSTLPAEGDNPYEGFETNGTVTVVQQPNQTTPTPVEKTNESWVREGAEWAVTNDAQNKGVVTSGSAAASALNRYLAGEDLSYGEGAIVDAVIKEKGQPPEGVSGTGIINRDAPGQKQGVPSATFFHTVKGAGDNDYSKLIKLYYGSTSQNTYDLIQGANVDLLGFSGPFTVGTKVKVPKYGPPKYFKATKTVYTREQIASRNGTTPAAIEALNNTSQHTFKVGQNVRVA